tara:strand:- start:444 stop:662 length:219 start_codon:yes stop_codon:yes gene_type:complete
MPAAKESVINIIMILEFFSPEYLRVINSLLLNNFIKKIWEVIKKINGNISKIIEGELSNAKKIVKLLPTLIF